MFRGEIAQVPEAVRAWRDVRRERRGQVPTDRLAGEAGVLRLADRMREVGGGSPATLYGACVAAFHRREIGYDAVTPLYRHACQHALIIVPVGRPVGRCSVCDADLS